MTTIKSVTLHSTHQGADKIYQVSLESAGDAFVVDYQNGKRGGTLASGTKTATPVPLAKAEALFERIVKEKVNGSSHYKIIDGPGPSGQVGVMAGAREESGVALMLLAPVDESDLARLLKADEYILEEKKDGERLCVACSPDGIQGIQKQGYVRPIPEVLHDALKAVHATIDGELVGEIFHVFDLLSQNGVGTTDAPYSDRRKRLSQIVTAINHPNVWLVPSYHGHAAKQERFTALRNAKAEGVVFKDADARYDEGMSKSALKFKFTGESTVVVHQHVDGKRSVQYAAFDEAGNLHVLGKVTIPANEALPNPGDCIEVGYLYANPGTNVLFQPVYKGVRTDQAATDCQISKFKFKAEEAALGA